MALSLILIKLLD